MTGVPPRPRHATRPAEALILTAAPIAKLDWHYGMSTPTMWAATGIPVSPATWPEAGGCTEPGRVEAASRTDGFLPSDALASSPTGLLCRTLNAGGARDSMLDRGLTGAGLMVDGLSDRPLTWAGMPARPHGWSAHGLNVADDLQHPSNNPCGFADAVRSVRIFIFSPRAELSFVAGDGSPCGGHRVGPAAFPGKPFPVAFTADRQALSFSDAGTAKPPILPVMRRLYASMVAGQMPHAIPGFTTPTCRACDTLLLPTRQPGHLAQRPGDAGSELGPQPRAGGSGGE